MSYPFLLAGGEGRDYLYGGEGNDQLDGGAGDDFLFGGNGNDTLLGGAGADQLFGENGDDIADGGDGNDYIYAGLGNDVLTGGDGNDKLYGGAGRDVLVGGAGSDDLFGESEDDLLLGGSATNFTAQFIVDIRGIWTSGATLETRIQNIRNRMQQAHVDALDDGTPDRLWGGAGRDWLLADRDGKDGDDDRLKDLAANDVVDALPSAVAGQTAAVAFTAQNSLDATDVNDDGRTTAQDALLIVNRLNRGGAGPVAEGEGAAPYYDVDGNNWVSARDALVVINTLNRSAAQSDDAPDPEGQWLMLSQGAEAESEGSDSYLASEACAEAGPLAGYVASQVLALAAIASPMENTLGASGKAISSADEPARSVDQLIPEVSADESERYAVPESRACDTSTERDTSPDPSPDFEDVAGLSDDLLELLARDLAGL